MVFMLIIIRILELKSFFLKPVPLFSRFPKWSFTPNIIENLLLGNYGEVLRLYWQPRCDILLKTNGHIKLYVDFSDPVPITENGYMTRSLLKTD